MALNFINKKELIAILASISILLSGCTGTVQLMPRDSGKVYAGTVEGGLSGTGKMTVTIDGERFSGPIVRTTSSESFGIIQQFGRAGVSTGMLVTTDGAASVKGILSSPSGRGLRCEFTSNGNGGGGICLDDEARVYDAVVSR